MNIKVNAFNFYGVANSAAEKTSKALTKNLEADFSKSAYAVPDGIFPMELLKKESNTYYPFSAPCGDVRKKTAETVKTKEEGTGYPYIAAPMILEK